MTLFTLHGDVAEIILDNPPVNALGRVMRERIVEGLRAAQADPAVRAVVLRGAGRHFSGGADVAEFDSPFTEPFLPAVIDMVEASDKPVVAAIHGSCLGGGLELAMGCHARVAGPSAKLGLPEVKLGLMPGAGGTVRLPRLVGVERALPMITFGDPVGAEQALEAGLVDQLAGEADLADAAIALARSASLRRTSALPVTAEEGVFERFAADNARKIKGDAPVACIEAIRRAVDLPYAQALEQEGAAFGKLMRGDQSKALRHIFFAERAAAKVDDTPRDTQERTVRRIGVIGAGTMGGGIAMNFLSAGFPVSIVETSDAALERGVAAIRNNYAGSVKRGRISQAEMDAAMALLDPTLRFEALSECDLVIEAVYEELDIKKAIFARLDGIARPGTILATNTSFLDVNAIAAETGRPESVVGMHFFSPANIMRLLEVVRTPQTAPDVLATVMTLARKIGKVAVVAGVCHGFIGNRMLDRRQQQAVALVLEGASLEQIDKVHTDFGMPMGPFQMADLAGVDIGWHRDTNRIDSLYDAFCAAGRWGQKVGKGFYDYDEKRVRSSSAEAGQIVADYRKQVGIEPRAVSDEEIVARTLYIMINEGGWILDEKIAQRPGDIDTVWLNGYGWPALTGGPMFWAQTVGKERIAADLRKHADNFGPDFAVAPFLAG